MATALYASIISARQPLLNSFQGRLLTPTILAWIVPVVDTLPCELARQTFKLREAYSTASRPYQVYQSRKMSSKKGNSVKKDGPSPPRPSSSVIIVSPRNEILLLHRVQTSSSFPSAHVFPGGNLSAQDGDCPPENDVKRHEDSLCYRRAAIRELFEESGILLAKDSSSGRLLAIGEDEKEKGRKSIHMNEITFMEWIKKQNSAAELDTDRLIPFSRWITPSNVPRRYTTQMYLYFLPLPQESDKKILDKLPTEGKCEQILVPTGDGGIEVTEAMFLPASEWLQKARKGEIILFPPQFLLLHLVAQFLDKQPRETDSIGELEKQRSELLQFVHSGSPPWTKKCISPKMLTLLNDGRVALGLDHPGPELKGTDKKGDTERAVIVRFSKGAVKDIDVWWKKDVFSEDTAEKSNL